MDISDYISLSSAIIALSAMGIAVWQGYLARKHNILSVTPNLQINTNSVDGILLSLLNNGLGPAVIESFKIICGEKEYTNPDYDLSLIHISEPTRPY